MSGQISSVLESLKPNLRSLLVELKCIPEDHKAGNFPCPHPDHDDSTGSCSLMNESKAHCFGCGKSFDIFDLSNWTTGGALSGVGFISHVETLCKKYNVVFDNEVLDQAGRDKLDSYRAHAMAFDYMSNQLMSEELAKYLADRGIKNADDYPALGIVNCPDYGKMLAHLKTAFTSVFLTAIGFDRAAMYSPTCILFTIRDHDGAPVGFISRDTAYDTRWAAWDAGGRSGRPPLRYNTSPEKNKIYFKSKMLFGFDKVLKQKLREVYVFEGPFDWAAALVNGVEGAVALTGNRFTSDYVSILKRSGIQSITLCLDPDKGGDLELKRLILGDETNQEPGLLVAARSFRINVIKFPRDIDPNDFFVQFGKEAFDSLEKISAFEWVLRQDDFQGDSVALCENVLPFIQLEESHIRRESMIKILSDATGLSVEAIKSELQRLDDDSKIVAERLQKKIAEDALFEIKIGDHDPIEILKAAIADMESVQVSNSVESIAVSETLSALEDQINTEFQNKGPEGPIFSGLVGLQEDLNGSCKQKLIILGGVPNTGKTSLMSQITKELLENSDRTLVLVHTIDDTRAQFMRRLGVQFAIDYAASIGSPIENQLTLNMMSNPIFWIDRYPERFADLLHVRESGYARLKDFVRSGRLQVKDMTHSAESFFVEKMVKQARKDFGFADLYVVADNFHKYECHNSGDERIAAKKRSSFLKKQVAQCHDATIFSTVEYNKIESGMRPKNSNIGETGQIEYDADFIAHLFNALKAAADSGKRGSCDLWHGDRLDPMPIIEMDVGKNKICEVKGTRYYKFYPAQSRYESLSQDDVKMIIADNKMGDTGADFYWQRGKQISLKPTGPNKVEDSSNVKLPF